MRSRLILLRRGCVAIVLWTISLAAVPVLAQNPAHSLQSINPYILPAGTTTAVTLTGGNFLPTSVVLVDGAPAPTTYESPSSVSVQVAVAAGTQPNLLLKVENPAPGGGLSTTVSAAVESPISLLEATRILDETTFGPTTELIQHVQGEGLNAWLAEQFNTPTTLMQVPYYDEPNADPHCSVAAACRKTEWWNGALNGNDQLRQRVAFALGQIFVISDDADMLGNAISSYSNLLANDAFTNWYQIMTDVTLSPGMGTYLNMVNSAKAGPGQIANENFARENMQLFNTGLYLLSQHGYQELDSSGNPKSAYTEAQVQAFARAFTGWTYPLADGSAPPGFTTIAQYAHPMIPIESEHDETEKVLLNGTVLPAGQTAEEDLAGALTNIFNHQNVPPFICRLLIQHLVTGNPDPEYVARVTSVFIDNGNHVRGDMKAVLTAIFNDHAARSGDAGEPLADFGHLRDPITWTTHLLRAVGYTNTDPYGDYYIYLKGGLFELGDSEYSAPSVFNFYPTDYVIPGTDLNEPEFDLENTGAIGLRRSLADSLLTNTIANIKINLGADSPLVQLAANPAALVDAIGVLFAHGQLNAGIRTIVINEVSSVDDPAQRARLALYLITTASWYKNEY